MIYIFIIFLLLLYFLLFNTQEHLTNIDIEKKSNGLDEAKTELMKNKIVILELNFFFFIFLLLFLFFTHNIKKIKPK